MNDGSEQTLGGERERPELADEKLAALVQAAGYTEVIPRHRFGLITHFAETMADEMKDSPGGDARAPAFVTRLPFPPPVAKKEWQDKRLTKLVEDDAFLDYHDRCFEEIIASGRMDTYVDILAMIAHIGRLPEFDEPSYWKFRQEARSQHFTASQLRNALDLILNTSGPGELLPNAAAAWEFLAFVGDFVGQYAKHVDAGDELKDAVSRINSMSIMAFLVAVNAELGIRKDFW